MSESEKGAQQIFFNSKFPKLGFNISTAHFEWVLNDMVWEIALFNAEYEFASVFKALTKAFSKIVHSAWMKANKMTHQLIFIP